MPEGESTYIKDKLLNAVFRNTAFGASPANVYISLHTADPGLTGTNEFTSGSSPGYARKSVTTTGGFDAPADNLGGRMVQNSANITFAAASGNGQTATYFGIWDALTVGNFLYGGALPSSIVWTSGETYYIPTGTLEITQGPT
jgi:hypothetical protein